MFGHLRMAALLAWQAWEVMREQALGLGRLRMLMTTSTSNLVATIMLLQPSETASDELGGLGQLEDMLISLLIIMLLKRMCWPVWCLLSCRRTPWTTSDKHVLTATQ